jgi:hypothetical protein
MQQISICRLPLLRASDASCEAPGQFATGLVSPRSEFASARAPLEIIPPFAKGVTVGGIRFRYTYSINTLLAAPGLSLVVTQICIRSAILVLPLSDISAQVPGIFPTNLLHQSGTIPEENTIPGLGYTRPRILWRGYDELKFIGAGTVPPEGNVDVCLQTSQSQPDLQVVKSKVSLGHNDCLYFVTEVVDGMGGLSPGALFYYLELDLFGVTAVKPTTATRP